MLAALAAVAGASGRSRLRYRSGLAAAEQPYRQQFSTAVRQRGTTAMSAIIDITTSNSLADLAARIRQEHEAVAHAVKRGLEHAVAAGNLLLEAKAQLPHGQWLPWLKEHCQIPERSAQRYMELSRHAPIKSDNLADLTIEVLP